MDQKNHPLDNLQETHKLMCERVLEILQNPESTLAELKFAREFLKDNKIDAIPVVGSPLGRVADAAKQHPNVIKLPTSFPSGDLLEDDDPEVCSG